jgi:hypothetical protein
MQSLQDFAERLMELGVVQQVPAQAGPSKKDS